jgi:hypothetical protein
VAAATVVAAAEVRLLEAVADRSAAAVAAAEADHSVARVEAAVLTSVISVVADGMPAVAGMAAGDPAAAHGMGVDAQAGGTAAIVAAASGRALAPD